jgi:hypothetical protein
VLCPTMSCHVVGARDSRPCPPFPMSRCRCPQCMSRRKNVGALAVATPAWGSLVRAHLAAVSASGEGPLEVPLGTVTADSFRNMPGVWRVCVSTACGCARDVCV